MPGKPHPPRNSGASKSKEDPAAQKQKAANNNEKSSKKKQNQSGDAADTGKGKGKKPAAAEQAAATEEPKKPTTREIIGGSSWTGKLPVNLLSEHCQKQKWDKPEYTMGKNDKGFWSTVILRKKNPKTQEITTLPAFRLPKEHQDLANQPTALEARHFAATYALFRVASGKNMHLMMPPTYKDLWKGQFSDLKKLDEQEGRAWQYEADPFLGLLQREEARVALEKKQEQIRKAQAAKENLPGVKLALHRGASAELTKGWKTAPKIDMGKRTRREVEQLVREQGVWNADGIKLSDKEMSKIVQDMVTLGFRKSHVEEAASVAHSREEVLEWLIIHVPEEDLPKWCLPEGYSAGVSLASGNLKRENAIKRLAFGGYAPEVCEETYDRCQGDELKAAEHLQNSLIQLFDDSPDAIAEYMEHLASDGPDDWAEEQEVLASIMGSRYQKLSQGSCKLQLNLANSKAMQVSLTFHKPAFGYPMRLPVLSVEGSIPAYIRLSITRRALRYAADNFLGVQMLFNIADWIEHEGKSIIDNPGPLAEVAAGTGVMPVVRDLQKASHQTRRRAHPEPLDRRPGSAASLKMLQDWEARQTSPAQEKMLVSRQSLPAWQLREDIANAVRNHQVTIISGETGSGKSTQSVQFILDDMINRQLGAATNIICTQPRRISALGLADRVADERCGIVGQEVGYAIRGDSKQTPGTTKITFVTTGILLRRLQTSGGSPRDVVASLADVSCIVVDEVHERSVDSDFLLCLLRDVLRERKDLKLVLMSATLDADVFERYFDNARSGRVAKINIEGRTHPVTDYYLDDIVRMTGLTHQMGQDFAEDEQHAGTGRAIRSLGIGINYNFIADLVRQIDDQLGVDDGAILIFLPGVAEISRTLDAMRDDRRLYALPLHAGLIPAEQRRVFPSPPRGKRKVIASTNVAETSITIPDVVAVIDSGRVKETRFDPVSSMVKLEECWASRAACKQRRGRAGRVQAGICYKLFTRAAEAKMSERPEPEIRRMPLEQLCLSVKAMGVADVPRFLGQTLTPPESLAVEGALRLLERIGALETNNLTALGQHMALLPTDLRCAKLMVYGALFECLDSCVTIASILTIKSPFVSPQAKRDEAKALRESFGKGQGDVLADLEAYDAWKAMRDDESANTGAVRRWCDQNYLSFQVLSDISTTRQQYYTSLKDIGFLPATESAQANRDKGSKSTALLHALVLSAFNPNILRIQMPSQKFQASMTGATAIDPEAREIRFFDSSNQRAFVHPSSTLFSAQSFSSGGSSGSAAFLSYWQKVETSKAFVRELSPAGVYAMCLFGGKVEIDAHGRGLLIDGWARVRGWARIGVLLGRMKSVMEGTLRGWVEDPGRLASSNQAEDEMVRIVKRLVELEGLDN